MTTHAFAFYRLPHATEIHQVRQCEEWVSGTHDYDELDVGRGFVVAPFQRTADSPMLIIAPDEERVDAGHDEALMRVWCDEALAYDAAMKVSAPADGGREAYRRSFAEFHQQVCLRRFEKLVLARQVGQPDGGQHPVGLFLKACDSYPRLFITLFYTPQSGLWLTATPELLLEQDGGQWHTVALAGTMRYDKSRVAWSMKNRGEQLIVADYVARLLQEHADGVRQTAPATVRAAHLMHLRTDFRFDLRPDSTLGRLVGALHPTPAVCGLPKEAARTFIVNHEQGIRRYYSGFAGPWRLQGGSHLFVSLRCMTRSRHGWTLFAGGGIVPDSDEETEWRETEEKLITMRRLFDP